MSGTNRMDGGSDRKKKEQGETLIRSLSRQLSKHISSNQLLRRSSSFVVDQLPETPAGWTVLVSALSSALLGYEVQLQKSLTCPPLVYGQIDGANCPMKPIYDELTETPDSILSRDIQPSLLVGTRKVFASMAACRPGGPALLDDHIQFRQIVTMSQDGATIALDWELPILPPQNSSTTTPQTQQERKNEILNGPIQQPVVLIMHGMANDSSFWYVRSLMRTCTDRGWVAVGMNMRGCGGIPLSTPRGYNGAYTGDLRCVVRHIEARLAPAQNIPLFIVGYSLGANLISKYLGEEGLSGTLPKCVAGGIASGNPLVLHSNNLHSPWSEILGIGAKKTILHHWRDFRQMNSLQFQGALRKALLARNIADFDEAVAPICIRNEPASPYSIRVGFDNAQHYWTEASSYKLIRNVSIPMLQIISGDDFVVAKGFKKMLSHLVMNPYIMTVETQCGGHLGWQESPPVSDRDNNKDTSTSWADKATADFIEAIMKTGVGRHTATTTSIGNNALNENKRNNALQSFPKIQSKL